MTLLLAALLINILLFTCQYRRERRSLLVAFFLLTTLLSLAALTDYIAINRPGTLFSQISLAVGALALIGLPCQSGEQPDPVRRPGR
ncbi:MAG TPA: hypothetical protein GX720_05095 [Clostridiaceae bacterium]|nr:hypothetical protein [Clostridiaceae bacterium]